jgi:hypothetical protein
MMWRRQKGYNSKSGICMQRGRRKERNDKHGNGLNITSQSYRREAIYTKEKHCRGI